MDGNGSVPPEKKLNGQDIPPSPEIRNSNTNRAPQSTPAASSLADRIQSSASGLFQNTILNTRSPAFGNSLSSSLAGNLANSEKPGSHHSHASLVGGESSRHPLVNDLGVSSGQSTSNPNIPSNGSRISEPFRSNWSQQSSSDLANYENDTLPQSFETQMNLDPASINSKGKSKVVPILNSNPSPNPIFESAWPHPAPAEQNSTFPQDGSAVIDLLSSSSFDPLAPSSIPPSPTLAPLPDTLAPGSSRDVPLSPLSLLPDIQSLLTLPPEELGSVPTVAEWLSLDARYTDEVWGGALKEYTEEARREVEGRKEKGMDVEGGEGALYGGPAVRRLGMVLAHLRERGT